MRQSLGNRAADSEIPGPRCPETDMAIRYYWCVHQAPRLDQWMTLTSYFETHTVLDFQTKARSVNTRPASC